MARYIEKAKIKKVTSQTKELTTLINDEYFDTYDNDNFIRLQKSDILVEEKAKITIIIMNGDSFVDTTIINGNHRVIYMDKNYKIEIEGYLISLSECSKFAITADFNKLYMSFLNLSSKIYGFNRFSLYRYNPFTKLI